MPSPMDLVKTQSTLLLPASVFGYPYPYLRIGLGRHNFPEALARLEKYLATRA